VLLLSMLSERFVERPFRKRGTKAVVSRLQVFALSAVVSAAIFLVGAFTHLQNGFESRFSYVASVDKREIEMPHVENGYCFRGFDLADLAPSEEACVLGDRSAEARTLLFGDSFAGHWDPYFDLIGKETGEAIRVLSTNWCFPSLRDENTAPPGYISRQQCDINRAYLRDSMALYDTIILGGDWGAVIDDGYMDGVVELANTILEETDANLIIMGSPPLYQSTFVQWAFFDPRATLVLDERREATTEQAWQILVDALEGRERVLLVDKGMFGESFAKAGRTASGFPYSLDGNHISIFGARALYEESRDGVANAIRALMLREQYDG
jgi:hypothetical protein